MNEKMIKFSIKKKHVKIFIMLFILSITIVISYAFLGDYIMDSNSSNIDISGTTSKSSNFIEGDPINIVITEENFNKGHGNLEGDTTSSVILKASNDNTLTSLDYYVYFDISDNTYKYTTVEKKPEILLQITDPEGNLVCSETVLNEVCSNIKLDREANTSIKWVETTTNKKNEDGSITQEIVRGLDVTEVSGLITIDENYNISTTNSVDGIKQDWTAKIVFVNLDDDQSESEGSRFGASLVLQDDEIFHFNDVILIDNEGKSFVDNKEDPNFTSISNTNDGLFPYNDVYGTSYYFRGAVDNNWVSFAGYYWRIIRINGDGTIRMIYSGDRAPLESEKVAIASNTLPAVTYGIAAWNGTLEYMGYMHELGNQHGVVNNSLVKISVDNWYISNILNNSDSKYIVDSIFCNDRTTDGNGPGTGDVSTTAKFTNYINLEINHTPSLICTEKMDNFTVNDEINGNGALTYPVGLITASEVILSGMTKGTAVNNYLYSNASFWTMSPLGQSITGETMMYISSNVLSHTLAYMYTSNVRPVININNKVEVSGTGFWNDPYTIIS